MELAINATASQDSLQGFASQQALTNSRRQAANPAMENAADNQVAQARRRATTDGNVERPAREKDSSQPARQPGFRIEYQEDARVLLVQDSKGVLIYQVPPKGELALLKALEQQAARQIETSA